MQKKDRQTALAGLISKMSAANQAELASMLNKKGFRVTQASVSRDLVELGVVKVNGRYAIPVAESPIMREFGSVTFDTAGPNMIVGKCASGLASAITVRIDLTRLADIVGTIAGDDTIFVAVKDKAAQQRVIERLEGMFV